MFNLRLALLILMCAAPLAQAQQPAQPAHAPKAVVPFTSFDFGDVYKGEIITHIFVIRNEGDAELRVKDFISGCGCTVAESDKVIPAGKTGMARLEINTASQAGAITKLATLQVNDPARPSIQLAMIANVITNSDGGPVKGVALRQGKHIGPIFIGPNDGFQFRVKAGQKTKAEFTLTVEKGPIKVLRVEGAEPHFTTRIETIEEGKSYRLVVETSEADPPGTYGARLRVVTDSAVLPYLPLSIYSTAY